jgi:hypothetical protein
MTPTEVHYPNRFLELLDEINVPFEGAVFLVGAGYLGKPYCQRIKNLGGIALDIGSIYDSWIGKGRTAAVSENGLRILRH